MYLRAFSPAPEDHRGTGSEYVFSALAKSIFPVAGISIHEQRHAHSPLSREYSRFVSYSHDTAVVIPRTALLARPTRITIRSTSPCAYFHDHGGISHERVQQALTFPPSMCYSYFYDNGASLTRPSLQVLSSHISPTMWATVDPLGFSQFDSLLAIVGPHTGAREGTIQRPARGGHLHRPSIFPSRRARHRGARQCPPPGVGRHPGSQHESHPCTGVEKVGSGVRFPSTPPPLRGTHQPTLVT